MKDQNMIKVAPTELPQSVDTEKDASTVKNLDMADPYNSQN